MKLIFCPECQDVVKLDFGEVYCKCEASWGWYESDGVNAVYCGSAVPLGFANSTLVEAIENQPEEGKGKCFVAFVIPKSYDTFRKMP